MKRIIEMLALMLVLGGGYASAQYQMILENPSQPNPNTFQFDLYIVSTGANFNLTSYAMQLTANSTIANGGTLNISYAVNSAGISIVPLLTQATVTGGVTYLLVASSAGNQTVSTTPLKMGTFTITNTVAFGMTPAAVAWDFTGLTGTMVNINNVTSTVPANHINALAPYHIIAQNDVVVNATTYEFDVVIVRTVADFTVTSLQVCFTYNSAVANGGTLTFSYIPGSSTLTAFVPAATQSVSDGSTPNFISATTNGSQLVSTTALIIGRFRVTNTVPFALVPMNIAWDFAGLYITQININNANITLQSNFSSTLGNVPLPVELVSFTGKSTDSEVLLKWKTASETNNYGFDIERRAENADWQKIDFLPGSGTANAPREYSYTDKNALMGNMQYRLKQIDAAGTSTYSDVVEVAVAAPAIYQLLQNSPNPFNPSTSIRYRLPQAEFVSIGVYDLLGREVTSLVNDYKQPGAYIAEWNGRDSRGAMVSSGVYIYRLTAGKFIETKKMNLMK
jgi:hypothetical protein